MVSSHKARKILRAENVNPKNVSVIVEGITKVIPWKKYEAEYLNQIKEGEDAPEEAEVDGA